MRKKITLLFLMVLFVTIKISAQRPEDMTAILRKCVDLPELQELFTKDSDGNFSQVYVLQHGVSFPTNTNVVKFGKNISFIEKSQLDPEKVKTYFLFWEFTVNNDSAKVDFVLNYIDSTGNPATIRVILEMKSENGNWTVVKTTI